MNHDELEQLLLRFGSDPSRWPPDRADAARRFAQRNAHAARMLAGFAEFDHLVRAAVRPPPFEARHAARVLAHLDAVEQWHPGSRFWLAGASATALSFAAGALAAWVVLPPPEDLGAALTAIGIAAGNGGIGGLL